MVIRSESEWLALFEKHKISGLSAAQFCQDEKLCTRYFSKRKKQLGWIGKKQPNTSTNKHNTDFIQVSVSQTKTNLTLECGSLKLNFNKLPPTLWFGDLVKALG